VQKGRLGKDFVINRLVYVGILALSTCTNITVLRYVCGVEVGSSCCLEVRGCSKVRLASLAL